jgi:hypothetical protein
MACRLLKKRTSGHSVVPLLFCQGAGEFRAARTG